MQERGVGVQEDRQRDGTHLGDPHFDGERSLAAQYYGQCIYAGPNGWYSDPWGGLGGGGSTGRTRRHIDTGRDFVFIHELGHGWNLPHGAGAADKGEYPYEAGGLKGSTWAYDVNRNEMIDVYAHGLLGPNDVSTTASCAPPSRT